MAAKLNIQGDLIGTTAEHVEYGNSDMDGVTHAKGALDNLNTRMKAVEQGGGGGTPTTVESAADVPYSKQGWTGVANVKQALDDVHDRLEAEGSVTGPVVYAFGDSISADGGSSETGSGFVKLSYATSANWPRVFARKVNASKFVNYGVGGLGSGGIIDSIPRNINDADIVTMMAGVNDSSAGTLEQQTTMDASFSQSIADLVAAVNGLSDLWGSGETINSIKSTYLGRMVLGVARVFSSAPNAKLILCGLCWRGEMDVLVPARDDTTDLNRWKKRNMMNMRAGLKRIADYYNETVFNGVERIIYVNTYNAGINEYNQGLYYNFNQYLHPNKDGSEKIGEYVYRKAILKEPDKYIDMPRIRIEGNFVNSKLSFNCAAGGSQTLTLVINAEGSGDLAVRWHNGSDSSMFSFPATVEANETGDIINKEVEITFTAPANATSEFELSPLDYIRFDYVVNIGSDPSQPKRSFSIGFGLSATITE